MSRALNRHHRARLKRSRRYYWGRDLVQGPPRQLGRVIDTPHPCSCLMCGNERAHAGRTMQERRADAVWGEAS